ncbi:MAG: HEAT repeat domain-containing protein [Gammaproteobacteria bacterium]|nr:HEAT repeat domain-containing protein [Gammaproteobacteria bacterium]
MARSSAAQTVSTVVCIGFFLSTSHAQVSPTVEQLEAPIGQVSDGTDAGAGWRAAQFRDGIDAETKGVVAALIAALKDDTNTSAQIHAALTLGEIGTGAAVSALIDALTDHTVAPVRGTAAAALGRMGVAAKAAAPALINALTGDAVTDVRISALAALGRVDASTEVVVPALIAALGDTVADVRQRAAKSLGGMGAEAKAAVPALIATLKGDTATGVTIHAAHALGEIGSDATAAVPVLIKTLTDHTIAIARGTAAVALGRMGMAAKAATPALVAALQGDEAADVRARALIALGRVDVSTEAAVPAVISALSDTAAGVRERAALALGAIGPDAVAAVPALVRALSDDADARLRWRAAKALGDIGEDTATVASALITTLQDAPNAYVREQAADALGNVGHSAKETVPALIIALNGDTDAFVRRRAAESLERLAIASHDTDAATNRAATEDTVRALLVTLKDAPGAYMRGRAAEALKRIAKVWGDANAVNSLPILREMHLETVAAGHPQEAIVINGVVIYLERIDPNYLRRFQRWLMTRPMAIAGLVLVALYLAWALCCLIALWRKPRWILKINQFLEPADVRHSIKRLEPDTLPIRNLLFVGLLRGHPRVLDVWVADRIVVARSALFPKDTVHDSATNVCTNVKLAGQSLAVLKPAHLRDAFKPSRVVFVIQGESGIGKSLLAWQIARWGLTGEPTPRMSPSPLLPILIEGELSTDLPAGRNPVFDAVSRRLQSLVHEASPIPDDLIADLLRKKRLLVIVDGLSEMSGETRKCINPVASDFPVSALIVTSRFDEHLGGVDITKLEPQRPNTELP